MPYRSTGITICGTRYDRRQKLTPEQRAEIFHRYMTEDVSQHQLDADGSTDEKQQEQRSQIPKHSLHHVIPLQNGNHQFQLIILPVGHTESGTHDTYRLDRKSVV